MAANVKPIVYNWILDYFCFCAWEEFKRDKKLSNSLLDSLSGLLGPEWEGDCQRYDKKIFLILLARIADGEDITMRYEESNDLSPLEDLLPNFKKLVDLQLPEDLVEEGLKMYEVVKFEAVCVHLRQKEFKLAQNCFSRIFTNKDELKQQNVKKLKRCISEKKNLGDFQYQHFVDTMIIYLQKIVDQFDQPLLMKAAEYHLEAEKLHQPEKRTTSRNAAAKSLEEITKNSNSNNATNLAEDKQKMRKLWDKNVRDMFGSPSPEKTGSKMLPPPTPPKPGTPSHKSKGSRVGASSASPIPSTSTASPTVTRPPIQLHTPSPGKKRLFESPHSTPSKSARKTDRTPTKDTSPGIQYKKNKGRQNRHEPTSTSGLSSSRNSDRDDISVVSYASLNPARKKWSEDEMLEFFNAVKVFGVGKWAEIKTDIGTSRTGVMLKDKWRTMIKVGDVDRLEALYNKKKQKKK